MPDKKDWYAIAQEAEDEDQKKTAGKPKASAKPKAPSSAARKEWYDAAGAEVPEDAPPPSRDTKRTKDRTPEREYIDVGKQDELLQVSAGRRDPPWALIGGVAGVLAFFGLAFWVANRKPPAPVEEQVNLPIKNIQKDISYGFEINPPDGFKQNVVPEPEWLQGVHGQYFNLIHFKNQQAGVEAFYYGELKKGVTLEQYASVGIDLPEKGKITPVEAIPEGMSKFPTKGYVVEFGNRKGLFFVSQDKDIFVSVYALTTKANFDKASEDVQAAVRALKVMPPSGPHPDKAFAPQGGGE